MVSYYKELKQAFVKLNKMLETAKEQDIELNLSAVILDLTTSFEIGTGTIIKRLELIQETDPTIKIDFNNKTIRFTK